MSRPHILYVLSDEHRGQALSHLGDPNVCTPVMDRLASEGASFARAYSNCPVCVPARGTILSGRHAHAGPVSAFWDNYKIAAPSTATILRGAGYHTCFIGKWHLGMVRDQAPPAVRANPRRYRDCNLRTPERHRAGFQDWFAYEAHNQHIDGYYYRQRDLNPTPLQGYITDNMTDLAIEYLRGYERPEPLFLILSICPPHFPLLVPEKWQRFDPSRLTVRPNFNDTPQNRRNLALYYAMIENLDWNIGRLMDAMRALPRFADTLTVYFSDHGEFVGSHGQSLGKELPQEESIRVPAIFHHPGRIAATGARGGLFSLVDMLPTTLALAGLDVPPYCQGADWSPALLGRRFEGPSKVLIEMVANPRNHMGQYDWRGFMTDRWKYTFFEDGRELLLDLQTDPYELHNLAQTDSVRRQAMRKELVELLDRTGEPYFQVLMANAVRPDTEDMDAASGG